MASAPELSRLPRVLVITSNNFNLQGGGGITLTNLFRGWPPDRIANIHEDGTAPDRAVCPSEFRLSRREVHWSWPFSLIEPRGVDASNVEDTRALAVPAVNHGWKRRLVGDGVPRDVAISPALESWIDAFHPDLAYSFLGSTAQIRLMNQVADRWHVPVAVHIMDDWPAVIYTEGVFGPFLRKGILREFQATLARAAVRMVICDAMAREYRQRYGRSFLPFQNALDMREWSAVARRRWDIGRPAVVRYVGSILAEAQRNALKDVCDVVAELQAENVDVRMEVHSPGSQTEPLTRWDYRPGVLRIEAAPSPHDVPRLLSEADVLLLPFNFDALSRRYIRLSMPTKVPAYMISGTPILAYGPPEIATIEYAAQLGWAETVTDRNPETLKHALRTLVTDGGRREELGRRAMALARERHELTSVRAAFWRALADARTAPSELPKPA